MTAPDTVHPPIPARPVAGHAGDWIEAHVPGGGAPRRGQILAVLGRPGHEHYHVRWLDDHESVFFVADGVRILPGHPDPPRRDVDPYTESYD